MFNSVLFSLKSNSNESMNHLPIMKESEWLSLMICNIPKNQCNSEQHLMAELSSDLTA